MDAIKDKVQKLISIVKELESDFPGRHFTLDGHLVGSIGEVMAAYYYGIELYSASTVAHDGEANGRKIQIKDEGVRQILVDKETGVNYLCWKSGYGAGVTPLPDNEVTR